MLKALALVRNLNSSASGLDFGEFTINPVGPRFNELRQVFSSSDVNRDDWIFEKFYSQADSLVEAIAPGIEEILLLLRLYDVGDIAFVKLATIAQSVSRPIRPYRAMNDLNSYSRLKFEIGSEKCESWKAFADGIRESRSWSSDWFAAARRFFLSGGAKPFNPARDDVDRIVDYVTALESTLVPENGYNIRRITRRAATLIAPDNPAEKEVVVNFMKKLYAIRSQIVHGSRLADKNREWLFENCSQVELRVRQILRAAVQKLPPGEADRRVALAGLYDPTDEDRGSFVFEKFSEIKEAEVRKAIATKIARLVGE
jgi:hypothetical protein